MRQTRNTKMIGTNCRNYFPCSRFAENGAFQWSLAGKKGNVVITVN